MSLEQRQITSEIRLKGIILLAEKESETKKSKPKKKRLSKGQRKHIRRQKQEARKSAVIQN